MAIDKQIYYWAHMLDEAFHIGESNNRSAAASKRMNNARQAKYDEYYTSYENAPKLLLPFKQHLAGKRILMPCDNPDMSQMFKWVFDNFDNLRLASLSCTGYNCSDMLVMNFSDDYEMVPITNNGDFTTGESLKALDECDVVIGNPPFSQHLGMRFLLQPLEHGKDVIGIESPEKCTYGELKDAVISKTLTVYSAQYKDFNVPIDQATGQRVRYDSGVYKNEPVRNYIFSSFDDIHSLKLKLGPLFKKATEIGVSYDDLPDAPAGPRADRVDIKVLYDKVKDKHASFEWIPPKPKNDGIRKPMLAISCYDILGYNWERYFNIEKVASISGMLKDPHTEDDLKQINSTCFIFSYK